MLKSAKNARFSYLNQAADEYDRKLNGCINVLDSTYDIQLEMKDYESLKVGEVPISSGHQAELAFTFRHDAPVLAVRFSVDSKFLFSHLVL